MTSAAGRSATTVSSSAAVGSPPGKAAIAHPPPCTQSRSGREAAYDADVREVGGAVDRQAAQVAGQPLEPALHRVDVRVGEARQEQRPAAVDDLGAGRAQRAADRHDAAVAHEHVADVAEVAEAVEDACVGEDGVPHRAVSVIAPGNAGAARGRGRRTATRVRGRARQGRRR